MNLSFLGIYPFLNIKRLQFSNPTVSTHFLKILFLKISLELRLSFYKKNTQNQKNY